jgi:hypothetical protein
MRKGPLLAAFAMSLAAPAVNASCAWEWMCNGEGSCKQLPVCDSVYEVPPARPQEVAPTPPPIAMRPHHIGRDMTGLDCEDVMRRSPSGHWSWDRASFCADPLKARDPTTPFSNIVRCEPPWKQDSAQPSPRPSPKGDQGTAPT